MSPQLPPLQPRPDAPPVGDAPEAVPRWDHERLALALDAARASIWEFDVTTGIATFDAGWGAMLRGPAEPTRTSIRRVFARVHPEERPAALKEVQDCLAGRKESYDQIYRILPESGCWIWVHSRGRVTQRDAAGRAERMVGINIDVSHRKSAEIAVARDAAFQAALNELTMSLLQRRAKSDVLGDLALHSALLFGEDVEVEVALITDGHLVVQARGGLRPGTGGTTVTCPDLARRAMQSGEPAIGKPPAGIDSALASTAGSRGSTAACFPILLDGRALGVLGIVRPGSEPEISPRERERGVLLARLAALVLHHAGVYEDAVRLAEERAAALAEREQQYRQIVENINQGYYVANARSIFTYCNPAISLVTGSTPEELVGTSSFRLVAAVDRARVISLYRDWTTGTHRHVVTEFRVQKSNDELIWIEQNTQIIRDSEGRVVEFRNFLRDITERKRVMEALEESEQRFHGVFAQSPIAIALLTYPEGRVVEINAAVTTLFRVNRAQVIGRTSVALNLWVDAERRAAYLEHLRTHRSVAGFEALLRRPDGTIFTALYTGSLIEIGNQTYSLNSIQDISDRRQAETQRDRSLALARATLEATTDGILVLDGADRFESCNQNFVAMWRLTPELLTGEAGPRALAWMRAQLVDPGALPCSEVPPSATDPAGCIELLCHDGRLFECHLRPLGAGPDLSGRVLSFRDVTAARRSEAALRESERQFRSVFDDSPIPIILLTDEGTVFELNQAAVRTFGCARADAVGRRPVDLGITVDPADVKHYFRQIRRHGVIHGLELRLRVRSGATITVLCSASRTEIAGRPCLLNSLIDISAQTDAESALRVSELRFRTLADVAPVGIFSTDEHGRTTFVNRRWSEIAGLPPNEAMGDGWLAAVHPEDLPGLIDGWAKAVASDTPSTAHFRFRRSDGETIYLVGHSHPQFDSSGHVTGHVGTITDITSLHLAEEARRATEAQLRHAQKMESLGTLAGGIAHDFNNILTGILGFSQLARLDLTDDHPSAELLDHLSAAGQRAKGLVQQILTFSRKMDGQSTPVRIDAVTNDALRLLRSTVPAMVELRPRIDPTCPAVMADPTQIHQVVMNLCTNALHALPAERGWIEVGLQCRELTRPLDFAATSLPPGRYVVLSICDNGAGMPPEVLERIYEPFFTTKEAGKGTGLGLAVVHGIVASHGGAITVRSSPGKGTAFEIFLPALAAELTESEAAAPRLLPEGRGQSILLIDDDPAAGPAIAQLVNSLGYEVEAFDDPRRAWARFQTAADRYALAITDLAMPAVTGDQLASRLRALRPDLPIVLLSGYLEPGRKTALLKGGISAVLEKPPSRSDLAHTLARLLAPAGAS